MNKSKKLITALTFIVFLAILARGAYEWIQFGKVTGLTIFYGFLALSYFFNLLNWGDPTGAGEKDELDQHIKTQSARIGYFVLMILSGIILFASERVSDFKDIDNYPLLIVVGLTFAVLPVTEFIYSRKYR